MPNWWDKLQERVQDLLATTKSSMSSPASAAASPDGQPVTEPKQNRRDKGKDPLGIRGENVAAKHLQKLGYKIFGRNFKTPVGEIDIVARDGKTLVFCEVKTRAQDEPTPEEQVDPDKMHQLSKAAKFYLSRYGSSPPPARFDVVAVVWPQGQQPVIRHIPNAFETTF